MTLRRASLAILSLVALAPVVSVACGSSGDRNFVETDASAGSGGAGNTGNTGGVAGSGTGGTAGTSTGGTAGSSTGGTGGGIPDGGVACSSAAECDDGEECNGVETCPNGYCEPGTPKKDGDACTSPDGGTTVCFSGACVQKCTEDKECDDNDVCTGTEVCLKGSGICATGTPLTCEDNSPCTNNECDPLKGCYFPVIDNDGDGQAATTLGSCGKDCDDNDKTIFGGAPELCDGKDNNCNNQTDELAPTWYVDCDADTFAPNAAGAVQQCTKPTTASGSCNGLKGATWTPQAPGAGTTDCWDKDPDAHPYTAAENSKAFQDHAIAGAPLTVDYDYNCDGKEEQRYTSVSADSGGTCTGLYLQGNLVSCLGSTGWTSSVAPACGNSGNYTYCFISVLTKKCTRSTGSRKQECR